LPALVDGRGWVGLGGWGMATKNTKRRWMGVEGITNYELQNYLAVAASPSGVCPQKAQKDTEVFVVSCVFCGYEGGFRF
ncbi:MAG: hypothetical protein ACOX9C_09575, partial [Kiritimatiellia bacterium]